MRLLTSLYGTSNSDLIICFVYTRHKGQLGHKKADTQVNVDVVPHAP